MASSPSHRSSHSLVNTASNTSLSPSLQNLNSLKPPSPSPARVQQRRMTVSALPPPSALNLPEPVYGHPGSSPQGRPPSPLRNGFTPDAPARSSGHSESGDDDDDDDDDDDRNNHDRTWGRNTHTPVSHFAANFAQRVNSLISPTTPNRSLPSDAELEAEAERERDRSRQEAEMILTREAEERKAMEERILAMMHTTRSSPQHMQPPTRSQTLPNPPSPATSQKEGGTSWWAAAKSRLTPTKEKDRELLTPAQQVVHETKAREKDKKKDKGKDKDKDKEWPSSATGKYTDPAYVNLNLAIPPSGVPRRPSPSSPASPTPVSRPSPSTINPGISSPINLSPSPLRRGEIGASSPSREAPPLYANFNPQGTLDVHGTLLVIAKRFEKLERWTVSHVRALEERMGDVERWLVERENEKEKTKDEAPAPEGSKDATSKLEANSRDYALTNDLATIKEDMTELQSRVGELGREMAKLATSPAVLSSAPARSSPVISIAPQTSSSIVSTHSSFSTSSSMNTSVGILSTPRRVPSLTARESTSPPLARTASIGIGRAPSTTRTRLPYPHGDYASPDPALSPTSSPSAITPTHRLSTSISGLPNVSGQSSSPSLTSGLPNAASPTPTSSSTAPIRATSPLGGLSSLPPPKSVAPGLRGGSTSPTPTPRKRYTVALGGPIVAPPEVEAEYERERERAALGMAFFSSSPSGAESDEDEYTMYERSGEDDDGTSRASHVAAASARLTGDIGGLEHIPGTDDTTSVPSITNLSPNARVRAQSSYGAPQGYSNMFQSNQNLNSNETSKHRLRSQSTDFRYGPGLGSNTLDGIPSTPSTAKFVDPLVLRRQEKSERGRGKEKEIKALVGPGKKVPVGKLVAFFDSERT